MVLLERLERRSIQRDLDTIAALGADHLRLMLIWTFFQPNPKWVSTAHLEQLDQLLTLMGERRLDALVTVFSGSHANATCTLALQW